GSQAFGSRFLLKRDYAAELAAVLAFSAVAHQDPLWAVLLTDRVEAYIAPGNGRDQNPRVTRHLPTLVPPVRGPDLRSAIPRPPPRPAPAAPPRGARRVRAGAPRPAAKRGPPPPSPRRRARGPPRASGGPATT